MSSEKALKELMKVKNIGKITAKQLIAVGVDTPEKLAAIPEDELLKRFEKLRETGGINYMVRAVSHWIESAQSGEYKYSMAIAKYKQLFDRSFQNRLYDILYKKIKLEGLSVWTPSENDFLIEEEILSQIQALEKDSSKIEEWNQIYKEWNSNTSYIIIKETLKDIYCGIFEKELDPTEFRDLYGKDDEKMNRKCKYCETTEADIEDLINNKKIFTKRLYSRGRTMEIDQKDPNGGYIIDNIAICCYWCNNAKSDEFNEEEFKPIGLVIKRIWEERLK